MSGRSIIGLALLGPSCAGSRSSPADQIREEFAKRGSVEAEKIKGWLSDSEGEFSRDLAEAINGKLGWINAAPARGHVYVNENDRSRGVIDVEEKDKFNEAPPVYQAVVEDLRNKSPLMAQFKRFVGNATAWCLQESCKKQRSEAKTGLVLQSWASTEFLSEAEKGEFSRLAFDYLKEEHPYWHQTDVVDSIFGGAFKIVDRDHLPTHITEKLLEKAAYHFQEGQKKSCWKDSILDYAKAMNLAPENAEYQHRLGGALDANKQGEQALECFQKAVELEPNNAQYRFSVGQYFFNLKKYEEALPHYQRVIELMPNNDEYQTYLGVVLDRLGKLDEALFHHEKAVALKTNVAQWQFNVGITLKRLGRLLEALPYYQKAASLDPKEFDDELQILEEELAAESKAEPAPKAQAKPKAAAAPKPKPSGGWGF